MLTAIFHPSQRPSDQTCGERDEQIFGIKLSARAKSAADVDLNQIDVTNFQAEHVGKYTPVEEGNLRCPVDSHTPANCVPFRKQPACFHRKGCVPLHAESLPARVIRRSESRIGIAHPRPERHGFVRRSVLEKECVALGRHHVGRDNRQLAQAELDEIERALRNRLPGRDDYGDRLSDIAHLAVGDDRLTVGLSLRYTMLSDRNYGNLVEVGSGDDGGHSRDRACGAGVDGFNHRMRHWAAQYRGEQKSRRVQIGDKGGSSGQ